MADTVSSYFPQIENYRAFQPSADVTALSTARNSDPMAWLTHYVAAQEDDQRHQAYEQAAQQANQLRSALYMRKLANDRNMALVQHLPYDKLADVGDIVGTLAPEIAGPATVPAQRNMDIERSLKPGFENRKTAFEGLHAGDEAGYTPTDSFVPGDLTQFLDTSNPFAMNFNPAGTAAALKAQKSGQGESTTTTYFNGGGQTAFKHPGPPRADEQPAITANLKLRLEQTTAREKARGHNVDTKFNPDGSVTVTVVDAAGKVLKQGSLDKMGRDINGR